MRQDELTRRALVAEGVTVVANASRDRALIAWAEVAGVAARVDRRTPYGNPYVLGRDGDRGQVCDAYEQALPHRPELLARIEAGELTGRVLICHCYPQRCHGDALAARANARQQGGVDMKPEPVRVGAA